MSKIVNRIKYAALDVGKGFLKESMEMLFYWYHISYRPRALLSSSDLLGEFYSSKSVRQRLDRLHKAGHIHKIPRGKGVDFVFNKDKRFEFLSKDIGIKAECFKRGWDEKWRLVIYDVPEKKGHYRKALREYLVALGFGKVQDSCWVSCYDYSGYVSEYCVKNSIIDCVCVYEGKFFSGKKENRIVEEAWGLNKLKEEYADLMSQAANLIRSIETEDGNTKTHYQTYLEVFSRFKELLLADPFLPKNFSGLWKERENVEKTLLRIFSLLFKNNSLRL